MQCVRSWQVLHARRTSLSQLSSRQHHHSIRVYVMHPVLDGHVHATCRCHRVQGVCVCWCVCVCDFRVLRCKWQAQELILTLLTILIYRIVALVSMWQRRGRQRRPSVPGARRERTRRWKARRRASTAHAGRGILWRAALCVLTAQRARIRPRLASSSRRRA